MKPRQYLRLIYLAIKHHQNAHVDPVKLEGKINQAQIRSCIDVCGNSCGNGVPKMVENP
jgi:hypothetical protein